MSRSIRRSTPRAFDVTSVLAIALPLLVGLALFLTNPGFGTAYFHPPTRPALTRASAVCPGALGTGDRLGVAAAGGGEVAVGDQQTSASVSLPANGVAVAGAGKEPALITASGGAAPGLVATRSSSHPVAAVTCGRPHADQWFTGLGAGPTHDSFVELVNPNPGQAVADLTVLGDSGPIDVPALRGIAIPGRGSRELDLGALMPTRSSLALHAVVERGQVAVAVRDSAAHLLGDRTDEDWLPAQLRPSRRALLLGLVGGTGSRQLTVANPTDREVTATVRLVSANSVFTPDGAPTIDVGPQSVSHVDLAKVLGAASARAATGVQVVANGAVTVSLRSVEGGDVSLVSRSQRTRAATSAVLPTGTKRLVLGSANRVGTLTVVARSAAGKALSTRQVSISPRQALAVGLPAGAVRVDVTPERTAFRGTVVVRVPGGSSIVPLLRPALTGRLPFVKPGLPR